MSSTELKTVYRNAFERYPFDLENTELHFDLNGDQTVVQSKLTFVRRDGQQGRRLYLDGEDIELLKLSMNGRELNQNEYLLDSAGLTLLNVPARAVVEIKNSLKNPLAQAYDGLYKSNDMYCTQCEPEAFRKITFYPDRPDVLSKFKTVIEADAESNPVLLSNGNCIESRKYKSGRRRVTWEDPFNKASYLFALVGGDLEVRTVKFVTRSGRDVEVKIFSEPHNIEKCAYALDCLTRAMRWDEQAYGREYDLDQFMIVAVESFNMGAMENKGLNIFNTNSVLASPDIATDNRYLRVESVIAHEYFHNWSGNRVTCLNWFHLSLKEGFTVFRDSQFSSTMNGYTVKRIQDAKFMREEQFPEDQGPLAHAVLQDSYDEISNFYTTTIYEKGAELVRMMQTMVGYDEFRQATDLYFDRHDGRAVTIDDFVQAVEETAKIDLSQFRLWYTQAGNPTVEIVEKTTNENRTLTIAQACRPITKASYGAFQIPLSIGIVDVGGAEVLGSEGKSNGYDVEIRSSLTYRSPNDDGTLLFDMNSSEADIEFTNVPQTAEISVLRDFSAPVSTSYSKANGLEHEIDRLRHLALYDSNGFARWDAVQTLAIGAIREPDIYHDILLLVYEGLLNQLVQTLRLPQTNMILTLAMTLPDELAVLDSYPGSELDALITNRKSLQRTIGQKFEIFWHRLVELNPIEPSYSPNTNSMYSRALRNLAYEFLCRIEDKPTLNQLARRLQQQYAMADNLTDRSAALASVLTLDGDEDIQQQMVEEFYKRWKHEALVVDEWFRIQGSNRKEGGLNRVKKLAGHPDFTITNPNRARSLYGAFARANVPNFHHANGSGYEFYAESLLVLDGVNAELAARAATPLTRWHRFESSRQILMKQQLEGLSEEELSSELRDVINRALRVE